MSRVSDDATILKIKHEVLTEVAKLAFAGELEEKKENIPFDMIPGPTARFRCCIYKEREIIRQRVRLAEGKCPGNKESDNVVQVINSACEECPISSGYVVTDLCQGCLAKSCKQACNFGAITVGNGRSYIDPAKCKSCGKCAEACAYSAIVKIQRPCMKSCPVGAMEMDENGVCQIDDEKCIRCGQCIHACPFGAVASKADVVDVVNAIRDGKKVIAMLAPAGEGQFGNNITMASWRTAMKKVGFTDFVEVGLGGDLTAAFEAEEWAEGFKEGKKMTTSCCPAFVNYIRKHFPEVAGNISTTVSPMCAVSRLLRAKDPETVTVFVGPCIAKKSEAHEHGIEGNADYVLTFGEIRAIMRAKGVELEPEENTSQEASVFGKRFGNGGGVTEAVLQCLKETGENTDIKVARCSGIAECKKALTLLKIGRLPEDFIEGMICEGGCVGGPSHHKSAQAAKKDRDKLIAEADNRGVHENLSNYDLDSFSMHR